LEVVFLAIEELPLKRIRTPVGYVAEYESFRDGMIALANALNDLRAAITGLDRSTASKMEALSSDVAEVEERVSGLEKKVSEISEEVSGVIRDVRESVSEIADRISVSVEEKLGRLGGLVEEKVIPVLEGLKAFGIEISELTRLLRFLGLRLEHLEARLTKLEGDVKRLTLLVLPSSTQGR